MNENLIPRIERSDLRGETSRAFRTGLVFMAAVGTAILLWQLAQLLLIVFACALVAMIVYQFADFLRRRLRLPFALAFLLAVVGPLAFIGAAFWLFGSTMAQQFQILLNLLPAAFEQARAAVMQGPFGEQILAEVPGLAPSASRIVEFAQGLLSNVGTALSMTALILVGGIYFAVQPDLYKRMLLALVPPRSRVKTMRSYRAAVGSLHAWLKAQGVGMAFVGVATGAGLSILGIPGAPAIGLVAGLCEFVPYLGTFVVAIPTILIAFSMSVETGLWAIAIIVGVQQIQGNLVSPLAQSRLADLPPALTIFSLILFGVLMGPLGVILAVPLTVVGVALVKELVIEERKRRARRIGLI
ncbi:MAG: AI-2E family transporter [Sphingomonadaceae bacterium]